MPIGQIGSSIVLLRGCRVILDRAELTARRDNGHPRRAGLRQTARSAGFQQRAGAEVAELERKLATHDQAITGILKAIHELMNPPSPRRRSIGFTADI